MIPIQSCTLPSPPPPPPPRAKKNFFPRSLDPPEFYGTMTTFMLCPPYVQSLLATGFYRYAILFDMQCTVPLCLVFILKRGNIHYTHEKAKPLSGHASMLRGVYKQWNGLLEWWNEIFKSSISFLISTSPPLM